MSPVAHPVFKTGEWQAILSLVGSTPTRFRHLIAAVSKTYTELAQKNPDAYRPRHAMTLSNLGLLDYIQNRMEEARQRLQGAL